jgi:HK97 family phage prohead protease
LKLKASGESDGKRRFTGVASTISTDRMDDIVVPKGAVFKLPMPLLWQHRSEQPIGWVTAARITDTGIEVDCEIHNEAEPGKLKDRLDEAWQSIKSGLVGGLSIGFNPIEYSRIDGSYGLKYLAWEWLELSAVTIAANQEATILAIKSADALSLAALGRARGNGSGGDNSPGASGSGNPSNHRTQKGHIMPTLAQMTEARAQKAARLAELVVLLKTDGHEATDQENDEFDGLTGEVKQLDTQIRVARWDSINASAAKSVDGSSSGAGSASRGPTIIVKKTDKEEAFKGQNFTRIVIAKALARMLDESPAYIAQKRWGESNPTLVALIKAGVAGGGTGSGEWGAELAQADTKYTGDFIEFLYSKTIFDKLPLRPIPARVHVKGRDGASTGYWVGESKAIPATTADFSDVELNPLKVAALAVISNELIEDSSPEAEGLVRDGLVEASAQRIDTTFLSSVAASAGVSPAGILNGLTGIDTAGNDAAGLRADVKALYRPFITAKNASGLVYVMNPATAKALSLLVNALGQTEFPGLGVDGGVLLGDKVYTGDNVDPSEIILLKPSDIYRIGDTGVQISMSREAMIEQDTAPTGATDTPAAATANMTSMFQSESTAFKVVRRINFAKRRTSAVAYVRNADYDGVAS